MSSFSRLVPGLISSLGSVWLGLALGAGVLLALGGRTLLTIGPGEPWLQAWSMGAVLFLVAGLRPSRALVPGRLRGPLWLVAGALAAAVLGRHFIDGLVRAATEAPWSAPGLGSLDLADLTFLAALSVLLILAASVDWLRRPGLPLFVGSVVVVTGLIVLGFVCFRQGVGTSTLPSMGPMRLSLAVVPLSLGWLGTLVGPRSYPFPLGRPWLYALSGVLAAALMLVLGSRWLLLVHGSSSLLAADGVLLVRPGSAVFGPWGDRIGAGLEAAICLFAAVAVLILSIRISVRDLPGLRSPVLPLLGVFVALMTAIMPLALLVPAAGIVGWSAVFAGVGRETRGLVS